VKVRRDGPFVRLELPPPGRWVMALRPSTAMQLASVIHGAIAGTYDVEGIPVRLTREITKIPTLDVQIGDWPGKLRLTEGQQADLVWDLQRASESTSLMSDRPR